MCLIEGKMIYSLLFHLDVDYRPYVDIRSIIMTTNIHGPSTYTQDFLSLASHFKSLILQVDI